MFPIRRLRLVAACSFRWEDIELPPPGSDEATIKVAWCGICGTDVHAYLGEHPFIQPPVVLGHEFVGRVLVRGEGVSHLEVGDWVTMEPSLACGRCALCRVGRYNICEKLQVFGCQTDGAMAEAVNVPAARLLRVPAELGRAGALVEPTAVAIRAARVAEPFGKSVLVVGAGPIGILTVACLRFLGADKIWVAELDPWRLSAAQTMGARPWSGRPLCEVVVECGGTPSALSAGFEALRKGGRMVVVGVHQGPTELPVHRIQDAELEVVGSIMYRREEMLLAIELLFQREIDAASLITHEFPFAQAEEAFRVLTKPKGNRLKVLLAMSPKEG